VTWILRRSIDCWRPCPSGSRFDLLEKRMLRDWVLFWVIYLLINYISLYWYAWAVLSTWFHLRCSGPGEQCHSSKCTDFSFSFWAGRFLHIKWKNTQKAWTHIPMVRFKDRVRLHWQQSISIRNMFNDRVCLGLQE
jgi:hypothetical protein